MFGKTLSEYVSFAKPILLLIIVVELRGWRSRWAAFRILPSSG